ncbi:MAG: hypothetical protein AAFQ64_18800 [Pseudomonadota bacterium]
MAYLRSIARALLAISSIGGGTNSMADTTSAYHVIKMDMPALLREVARDRGASIISSSKARGIVRDIVLRGTLPDILNSLAETYGLDWFYYNDVYYVSSDEEAATRVIGLGHVTPEAAIAALQKAGLWQEDRSAASTFEDGVLILTGPPQQLALVESVIQYVRDAKPMIIVRRGGKTSVTPIGSAEPQAAEEDG